MSASVGCGLRADATNSKSTAIQSAAAGIADIEPIIILGTVGITGSISRTVMRGKVVERTYRYHNKPGQDY